ncbi:hypothetical protein [Sphingobium cloacae]|uniref:hypothetical protein n=2 Tax=Sphingobium cloacae TaxID=120107 RepID=UPI000F4FADC3|nr:hypothetical protein [Sphingobium cloacae]
MPTFAESSVPVDSSEATPTYTLYRNSPLGPADRVHWATFDAADKGAPAIDPKPYNQGNCEFAAEILNENIRRQSGGEMPAHFWCEKGAYRP